MIFFTVSTVKTITPQHRNTVTHTLWRVHLSCITYYNLFQVSTRAILKYLTTVLFLGPTAVRGVVTLQRGECM